MANGKRVIHLGLLQSDELYQYLLKTSVYPREADLLKELRAITSSHPMALMGTSPDAGQFVELLLKLINPKKTIEIGVFTGYSLLLTALNIPEDGKIIAIDPNRSAYEMGLPVIQKAAVEHKINFIESLAHPVLDDLLQDANHETFDFAFVDADKINYPNYHEKLLKLLKRGAIVIYDNTLWGGTVAAVEDSAAEDMIAARKATLGVNKVVAANNQVTTGVTVDPPENALEARRSTMKFNKFLAGDARVQISQVPLGDGITICRRL